MNKKAQGLSINVVVLLILAVIVLVVIIAFFSGGFGKVKEVFLGYFSKGNIDSIVTSCSLQCTTNQVNEFCNVKKNVRGASELGVTDGDHTCKELRGLLASKKPNLDDCSLEC